MSIDLRTEMQLYADLMTEIKIRGKFAWATIERLEQKPVPLDAFVQAEGVILQTRLICELVALASLAAHSKFGLNAKLLKAYHAETTFRMLEEVNPNCFPRPCVIEELDGHPHVADRTGQMDLAELGRIYEGCGRLLHRGVIKHILKGTERRLNLPQVGGWLERIVSLLNQHTILLLRHDLALIVTMSSAPHGHVEVQLAQSDGPSVLRDNDAPSRPPSGRRRGLQS